MSLMPWNDKYLIGNEVIDSDHKTLFAMLNEFYDAFLETKKRSDLIGILTRLVQYAEAHFQREEAIMDACGYMLLGEHHLSHTRLYETIYELNERLVADPAPLDRAAISFLKNWLVDHVVNEDSKIGEFLRQKKTDA
jgi:hemerythrin